jgi:hypothetical protein
MKHIDLGDKLNNFDLIWDTTAEIPTKMGTESQHNSALRRQDHIRRKIVSAPWFFQVVTVH